MGKQRTAYTALFAKAHGNRFFDCFGLQHVNPCGSFCVVSQRKGEKRQEIVKERKTGIGKKEGNERK